MVNPSVSIPMERKKWFHKFGEKWDLTLCVTIMKKAHQHQQSKLPVVGRFKAYYLDAKTACITERLVGLTPQPQSTHNSKVVDCHILFLVGNKGIVPSPEMVTWLTSDKEYMGRSFSDLLHAVLQKQVLLLWGGMQQTSMQTGTDMCLWLHSYRCDDWPFEEPCKEESN